MKEDFQLSGVRRKKIVDLVESLGSMAVKELCREFQVSEATIRRDLKELEEIGTVTRTHGGVMINSPSRFIDLPNEERTLPVQHTEELKLDSQYSYPALTKTICKSRHSWCDQA